MESKSINSLINIIPLINYVMIATRQAVTHIRELRWFESMYTLQGKSDTHDTYASHASPRTSLVCFLWKVYVRGNLLRWPNRVGWILLLLRKSAPDYIFSTSTDQSVGPAPVSLPTTTIEAIALSQASVDEHATSVY
jgi:hypothetical protein